MIDVVTLKANLAERSGDVSVRLGMAGLGSSDVGTSGTLKYTHLQPDKMTTWKSAEVPGLADPATDAIRIRLGDGTSQFYLDQSTMKFEAVTDESAWDSEFMPPWLLGNVDLWTRKTLQLVVHLVSTTSDRQPHLGEIYILVDHPTWPGVVAQTVKDVADFLQRTPFILIHQETLSADRGSWKIGKPHSEHNYDVKSIVQVALDRVHKSADLVNGEIILSGPAAKAGQVVEIAVNVQPSMVVRRSDESDQIHRTPAWWMANLVSEGGLIGVVSSIFVGGSQVEERESELRITVNGVAHRQSDALAMRAALQSAFADGLAITFPSGRCVFAQLDGLVEVIDQGPTNLPMVTGTVSIPLKEYVFAKTVRKQREDDVAPNQPGQPIHTEFTLEFPAADLTVVFDEDGFNLDTI
jgi:hypothetical protein